MSRCILKESKWAYVCSLSHANSSGTETKVHFRSNFNYFVFAESVLGALVKVMITMNILSRLERHSGILSGRECLAALHQM